MAAAARLSGERVALPTCGNVQSILVRPEVCVAVEPGSLRPAADGFVWLDALHEKVRSDPEAFRQHVEALTGTRIFDLHLQDAVNLQHPSFFDGTAHYDMLVFRKLAPGEAPPLAELQQRDRAKAL